MITRYKNENKTKIRTDMKKKWNKNIDPKCFVHCRGVQVQISYPNIIIDSGSCVINRVGDKGVPQVRPDQ